ncbi:MAG: hypothetical protein Q9211_000874 [Gyalolechia sp. 1 TL-2023]
MESYPKAKSKEIDLPTTLKRMSLRIASGGPDVTNPSTTAVKRPENRSSEAFQRKNQTTSTTMNGWDRQKEEKRNRSRFLDAQRRHRIQKESAEERKARNVGEAVGRWYRRGDGPAYMRYTTHVFDGIDGSGPPPRTENNRRSAGG